MKKDTLFVIFFILLPFIVDSCRSHKPIILENKIFLAKDSLRINTLSFFSNGYCLYTQEFILPIDERYRKTEIKCKYETKGNLIFLKNIDCPSFLKGESCFTLPDSIRDRYISIFVTKDMQIPPRSTNAQYFGAYNYGYINGIKDIDTLMYKKGGVFYGKVIKCYFPENLIVTGVFFRGNGTEKLTEKHQKKLLFSKKAPLNRD